MRETRQTTVPEPKHSSPCDHCGEDHPEFRCPWVDRAEQPCGLCGRQNLEWSEEAQEHICPNCGWPIGR